jgi:hypothetical protein
MTIKLSTQEVELKKEISWYDLQEVQAYMINSAKMNSDAGINGVDGSKFLEYRIKLFEKFIISIKKGEELIPFSIDWVKSLNQADGELLANAVDELTKKK